ncbi:MAG: hypothetical protein AAF693_12855 [Bacteroidota bacterium]
MHKIKGDLKRTDYFKRLQRDGIYHYIKVVGGSGRTQDGYQEVINFLNQTPIIHFQRNFEWDPFGLTGTWCNFEAGVAERITKEEYKEAYQKATESDFTLS